ncbi:MAG: hypothetical protein KDD02_10800 [Phaeodactylibacter sp.]|nr:hypothetical protein [Phaeodactylibacter sp.]MCB9301085.1 hypothetical protein [Lewinellaceae bacterium]HQU59506.1 hypothetical protein [Saprospiraceae bacterium]
MPIWLSFILEILKLAVPALIVFLTAYYVLKAYLDNQLRLKSIELRQSQQQTTLPLRLQAYERLSLFCERISIPSLLLRVRQDAMSSGELRLSLLLAIQQEYEHNITQQVYVSGQLWEIIKMARDEAVNIVTLVAEKVDAKASSKDLAQALFHFLNQRESTVVEKALLAIKKEAGAIF